MLTKVHKVPARAAHGGRETLPHGSERTRAAIREAANRLFLEHGVDNTTVDAICAAAEVSKGTFYLYFHRKEDLLLEYALRRFRRIRRMLPELIGRKSLPQALKAILDQ